MFLRSERCNEPDKLWVSSAVHDLLSWLAVMVFHRQGFTPLHLAANRGNVGMVRFLVEYGSSIYKTDLVEALRDVASA